MSRSNLADPAQRTALTPRQDEVLRLMAAGRTNAEIAQELGLSLDGAKWHVREILGRLGAGSREEAVARWREERTLGRRLQRMRALVLTGVALRLAGGVAAVAGLGATGVLVTVGAGSEDEPALAVAATPTVDPATNEGLTLHLVKVEADDTQTYIEVTLDGRPELGRLGSPPLGGPYGATLYDANGAEYHWDRMGRAQETNDRSLGFWFPPVASASGPFILQVEKAQFVDLPHETLPGQRPPDPSAELPGPWRLALTGLNIAAGKAVAVDRTPQPFGPGAIVIDDALQEPSGVVIHAHFVDIAPDLVPGLDLEFHLVDAAGQAVPLTTGSFGSGSNREQIEIRFENTTGPVTLAITGKARLAPETVADPDAAATQAAARAISSSWTRMTALHDRVEAAFAGSTAATWTITLPP